MKSQQPHNATLVGEGVLKEIKHRNIEAGIAPREVRLIDRLLARRTEMQPVYVDVYGRLHARPQAFHEFFQLALDAALDWNPQKLLEARVERDELNEVNESIASTARDLADLLQRRDRLLNTSGFGSDTHYHVCRVIESAAGDNYLFQAWVKEKLQALYFEFDLKYWPSPSEFVEALGADASGAVVVANDKATEVGTAGERVSRAHFFYALLKIIESNADRTFGPLPKDFRLTDDSWATLVNCLLDVGPDEAVGADYIKGARRRLREADLRT